MKLSRESQYGLAAAVYLAAQPPGTVLQASQLAEAEGLPAMFLPKILRKLTRHGVLRSFRGRDRGYSLARAAREINVREVLEAIEGPGLFQRCVFWSDLCSDDEPCLLHDTWKTVRPVMASLMEHISLEEVAGGHPLPGLNIARPGRSTGTGSGAAASRGDPR